MTDSTDHRRIRTLHPIHAILLAGVIPLFLGALLSDWAYARTYEIQWTNFASWLIAGGLIFAGFALVFAIIDALRADRRHDHGWVYLGLLLLTFAVGFLNSLIHAKDGWASMPMGLVLSIIAFVLAVAANWAAWSAKSLGRRP